jgi:D-arabinose 1-dehydrogenase-like Zn-dependent alcohol dehydrogenase
VVGYRRSDLSKYRGKNPMVSLPRIPGHEVAAMILECCTDVPGQWKPDTNVTLALHQVWKVLHLPPQSS